VCWTVINLQASLVGPLSEPSPTVCLSVAKQSFKASSSQIKLDASTLQSSCSPSRRLTLYNLLQRRPTNCESKHQDHERNAKLQACTRYSATKCSMFRITTLHRRKIANIRTYCIYIHIYSPQIKTQGHSKYNVM